MKLVKAISFACQDISLLKQLYIVCVQQHLSNWKLRTLAKCGADNGISPQCTETEMYCIYSRPEIIS